MHKLQSLVVLTVSFIVLSSCTGLAGADCSCEEKYSECSGDALNRMREAVGEIAFRYLSGVISSNCTDTVCAPLTTYYTLSFLGLFVRINSDAYNQVMEFSGCLNQDEIRCVLRLTNCFFAEKEPKGASYLSSDNIRSSNCDDYTQGFKCAAKTVLGGSASNYDSKHPQKAQRIVNNYIADHTCGCVENAVPCSDIFTRNCTASKILLLSGELIESLWKRNFDPAGKGNFTDMNNNTKEVDYVTQCDTYDYTDSKEINAQVIKLKYKDGYFENTFFIPNEGYTVIDILGKLQDKGVYKQVMSNLKKTPLQMYVPVYSNATSIINYVNIFKKLGILTTFYDAATSSIVDACTRISTNEYISEGFSKVILRNTIYGDEPNNCDEFKASANCEVKEIRISSPMVNAISRRGIITTIEIGTV